MSAAFYKTSDPAVLAVLAEYEAEVAAVGAAGKLFADHFGGRLLKSSGAHGCKVAGLRFTPFKEDPLWTKPDGQQAGMQRPRASLRKSTPAQRTALAALTADWNTRFPKQTADLAPVLAAIRTDWGHLCFGGIVMFQHDGAVYVSTVVKLAPCVVEILASEFNAAKAAYESVKESP